MILTTPKADRFGLARRLAVLFAVYAFVMQAFFAGAVAAQAAAWGGANALVICRGDSQPGGIGGGDPGERHEADCGQACSAAASAALLPPVIDLGLVPGGISAIAAPLLTAQAHAAVAARDGEARAPPTLA